jgi:K+-transporting ATPase KdpF subunit
MDVVTSGGYVLAGVLAVGLLIYLVAVLLRPEDFS